MRPDGAPLTDLIDLLHDRSGIAVCIGRDPRAATD